MQRFTQNGTDQALHLQVVVDQAANSEDESPTGVVPPDLGRLLEHEVIFPEFALERVDNGPHAPLLRGLLPKQLAHLRKFDFRVHFHGVQRVLLPRGVGALLNGWDFDCQFWGLVHLFFSRRQAACLAALRACRTASWRIPSCPGTRSALWGRYDQPVSAAYAGPASIARLASLRLEA